MLGGEPCSGSGAGAGAGGVLGSAAGEPEAERPVEGLHPSVEGQGRRREDVFLHAPQTSRSFPPLQQEKGNLNPGTWTRPFLRLHVHKLGQRHHSSPAPFRLQCSPVPRRFRIPRGLSCFPRSTALGAFPLFGKRIGNCVCSPQDLWRGCHEVGTSCGRLSYSVPQRTMCT